MTAVPATPRDAMLAALEQQLLTIDDDTVHDLLFEDTMNTALDLWGEDALRDAAMAVLLGVAGLLDESHRIAALDALDVHRAEPMSSVTPTSPHK